VQFRNSHKLQALKLSISNTGIYNFRGWCCHLVRNYLCAIPFRAYVPFPVMLLFFQMHPGSRKNLCDSASITSTVSKWWVFNVIFNRRKKSQGAKKDE
jgi:hypothetical protein